MGNPCKAFKGGYFKQNNTLYTILNNRINPVQSGCEKPIDIKCNGPFQNVLTCAYVHTCNSYLSLYRFVSGLLGGKF